MLKKITKKKILFVMLLVTILALGITLFQPSSKSFINNIFNSNYKSGVQITSLDTPTNLRWKEESTATATWDAVENANYYYVNVFIYNNNSLIDQLLTGTTNNMIDLQQEISYKIEDKQYSSLEIYYNVKAAYLNDSNDIFSLESNLSSKLELKKGTTKLGTPQNVVLNENKTASWTSVKDVYWYRIEYRIKYNEKIKTGTAYTIYPSEGKTVNGVYTANISEELLRGYQKAGFTNETVEYSIRVQAGMGLSSTEFSDGDYSEYSNYIYYNPKGSTIIYDITLSPNKPVIAIGRSIFIGKTIEPYNAYYSTINWSSSNNNIVSINNMGQITGLTKGTATITAKINNATQTAEVNVYEIKSNIPNSTEANNVLNEANDVIEAVVADGDISNTDITDKDSALNEIEQGAENGNKFSVDIKYNDRNKNDYNDIKEDISSKYKGYNIIGGKDIKIEISHIDNQGKEHHIANITDLDNKVSLEFDISSKTPELPRSKTREYKVVRVHDDKIEEIEFEIKNGVIQTSSNKFSDFIVLYSDTDIPANGISIDKESVEINVGKTSTIDVQVLPENAANKNFIAMSKDENIATVSNNIITAVAPGETEVVFTSVDGSFSKTVNVSVKAPLKGISLNENSSTKNVGETVELTVTYNPTNTTDDKKVTWTSSNENIAIVKDGVVTAINPGQAVITATVGEFKATHTIEVKLPLKNITLNKTEGTLIEERTEKLEVTYNPTNTTDDKTVTWTSSDDTIASVNNGVVTAHKEGTVTITATVGDKTATYNLTVNKRIKVEQITLNKTEETLYVGDETELIATISPDNVTDDKTVTWTSSDEKVATVTDGKVKAIAKGTVTITAKAGDKTAIYTLTITNIKLENIEISEIKDQIYAGKEITPSFTVKKDDKELVKDKDYTVSYENNINTGTATITITGIKRYEGTYTKEFKINKANIGESTFIIENQYYTGKAIKYIPTIKYNDTALVYDKDYTVSYKNNINIGTATMTITGTGNFEGTVTKTFKISLAPVIGLTQSAQSTSYVTIKWNKNTTLTGYEVYYSTSKNGTYKKVSTITKNSTVSYKKTGLKAGTRYYFKVRGYKTISGKKYYTAYTDVLETSPLPAKVTIKNPTSKSGTVTVSWNKVSNATGYALYYATSKNGKYTRLAVIPGNTTSYKVPGLKKGKTYYFKVIAYKNFNSKNYYGDYSAVKSVKVK